MTTLTTHWTDDLVALDACEEAIAWAKDYDSLETAWATCPRGDWMLWLAGRLSAGLPQSDTRKRLVLCECACARTSLVHVPEGDSRPLHAIETAERWARGEDGVTLAEVSAAAYAAASASASAAAAAYAAADAARTGMRQRCADIVRQHYPTAPRLESAR